MVYEMGLLQPEGSDRFWRPIGLTDPEKYPNGYVKPLQDRFGSVGEKSKGTFLVVIAVLVIIALFIFGRK